MLIVFSVNQRKTKKTAKRRIREHVENLNSSGIKVQQWFVNNVDYLKKDCITQQTEKNELGFYFKRFLQNTRKGLRSAFKIQLKNSKTAKHKSHCK